MRWRGVGGANGRPRCDTCHKGLIFDHPMRPRPKNRASFRAGQKKYMVERSKLVIRCLDCLRLFCPSCAKKHFLPQWHVHGRVLREVDRVVTKALKGLRCKTP